MCRQKMKLIFALVVFLGILSTSLSNSTCRTPNHEEATCIPLNKCTLYYEAISSNPSEDIKNFLKESKCDYKDIPWVCCGTVLGYLSVSSTPTRFQISSFNPWFRPERPNYNQYKPSSFGNPTNQNRFSLLPSRNQCGKTSLGNKIIGGNKTELDEFPWMALLEYRKGSVNNHFKCGGMLISDKYVLTAGHCVTGSIESAVGKVFSVRVGEYDLASDEDCTFLDDGSEECSDPPQDIPVEEVIPHPDYNPYDGSEHNDIALIRLRRPIRRNDFVGPICLPINGEKTETGKNLTVAGWGKTERGGSSNLKLKALIPYFEDNRCQNLYARFGRPLTEKQLCAGGVLGIDSCNGDSGGPLMNTVPGGSIWYVEGIVSYGPRICAQAGVPGVYTRVYHYIDWILENMRP